MQYKYYIILLLYILYKFIHTAIYEYLTLIRYFIFISTLYCEICLNLMEMWTFKMSGMTRISYMTNFLLLSSIIIKYYNVLHIHIYVHITLTLYYNMEQDCIPLLWSFIFQKLCTWLNLCKCGTSLPICSGRIKVDILLLKNNEKNIYIYMHITKAKWLT